MYKILIADDEHFILKGLSFFIPWQQYGCILVGTASNGLEAKECFDRLQPDFVLTDIVMPGMTGLELARYIREQKEDTIVILLTGYNEFSYAKEALKAGVFDYLLKPTDPREVEEVLEKAIKHLNILKKKNEAYEKWTNVSQAYQAAESSPLKDLVLGSQKEEDSLSALSSLTVPIEKGAVLVLETDTGYLMDSRTAWIIHKYNQKNIYLYPIIYKNQLILVPTISSELSNSVIEKRLLEASEFVIYEYSSAFKENLSVGIGLVYEDLSGLHSSYLSAVEALEQKFFRGSGKVFKKLEKPSVRDDRYVHDSLQTLVSLIDIPEKNQMFDRLLEELFSYLFSVHDRAYARHVMMEFLFKLRERNVEITFTEIDLSACSSFTDLRETIRNIVLKERERMQSFIIDASRVTQQALDIIHRCFDKPSLSLQSIAEQIGVSPSYLSRVFKKETGVNLVHYIQKTRLEKAKVLLDTTNQTTYEIALKVGFVDGRYFGQVFKKHFKLTPSEYRKY